MRARALRTECKNANYSDLSQLFSISLVIIYMRRGIFMLYCQLLYNLVVLTMLIFHGPIHILRVQIIKSMCVQRYFPCRYNLSWLYADLDGKYISSYINFSTAYFRLFGIHPWSYRGRIINWQWNKLKWLNVSFYVNSLYTFMYMSFVYVESIYSSANETCSLISFTWLH